MSNRGPRPVTSDARREERSQVAPRCANHPIPHKCINTMLCGTAEPPKRCGQKRVSQNSRASHTMQQFVRTTLAAETRPQTCWGTKLLKQVRGLLYSSGWRVSHLPNVTFACEAHLHLTNPNNLSAQSNELLNPHQHKSTFTNLE